MLKIPIKRHQQSLEVNEGSDTKKKEFLVLKRNNRNLTGFCQATTKPDLQCLRLARQPHSCIMAILEVGVGFQNCFGVYSCS